jgi:hypothetical protein
VAYRNMESARPRRRHRIGQIKVLLDVGSGQMDKFASRHRQEMSTRGEDGVDLSMDINIPIFPICSPRSPFGSGAEEEGEKKKDFSRHWGIQ